MDNQLLFSERGSIRPLSYSFEFVVGVWVGGCVPTDYLVCALLGCDNEKIEV